jgi:hypothetical protein
MAGAPWGRMEEAVLDRHYAKVPHITKGAGRTGNACCKFVLSQERFPRRLTLKSIGEMIMWTAISRLQRSSHLDQKRVESLGRLIRKS